MKKKLLAAVLMAVMVMSLAACGKKAEEGGGSQSSQSQTQTESQAESQSQTETQTQESEMESVPQSTEGTEPEIIYSSLENIREAVVAELGEAYWPQMAFDSQMLEMMYGITPDMYDAFLAEGPMMSAHVDALIVVQAKEDQVDAVKEALEAYRQNQVDNLMAYPSHVGKIQASKVEVIDNYVCYVILGGDVMELMDKGDDEVIKHCESENNKAIEAIKKAIEG